jgi:pyruvate dehydrogenase E2 component (dihydrolipoamide acetyltransferase)
MRVDFKLPDLGENIDSGDVVKLLVKVGDVVKPDQPLMELETGKAVVEVPSNIEGRVAKFLIEEGDKVDVGQAVITMETDLEADLSQAKEAAPVTTEIKTAPVAAAPAASVAEQPVIAPVVAPEPPAPARIPADIPAAPNVRRLARELGVDLSLVSGTGTQGAISEDDVRAFAAKSPGLASPIATPSPLPDFSRYGKVERKAMTSVRFATADHMSHAWTTIPQVTQYDDADITELDVLRKRYGEKVQQLGGKLTTTAVMLKVVASALRQFPHFNASVDMQNRTIIQKHYVHVGVAVNTERGLLVPVIRDADQKNISELAIELLKMTEKAHKRELKSADLEGGTFSITNLGTIGGTHFTPIVNWPEVAILGISRARIQPVWKNDKFEPRLQLPLSLSYDHRVIDGADGAQFLRWICEALEQPFFLALEG